MIAVTLVCVVRGGRYGEDGILAATDKLSSKRTNRSELEMKRREKILLARIKSLMERATLPPSDRNLIDWFRLQAEKDVAYAKFHKQIRMFQFHRDLDFQYSRAVYRPWTLVSEHTTA